MDGVEHVVSYGRGKERLSSRQAGPNGGGIRAGHNVTGIFNLGEELVERAHQLLERAVYVQVVRLDVCDDRDVWVVVEEGAVVLVRFDDEVCALAGHGVRRQVAHLTANHEGRGKARAPEHVSD